MAPSLPLSRKQFHLIALITFISFLYRSFTQRSPSLLFPPTLPALPTPHSCAVYHRDQLVYCEDFTTLPSHPDLLLSCDTSRRESSHLGGKLPTDLPPGELWLFNPHSPNTAPRRVSLPQYLHDFRPIGISAVSHSGGIRIFVANQASSHPTIEIFDLDPTVSTIATHIASISHPAISSPNSVVALTRDSFYITNDLYTARRSVLGSAVEVLTAFPGGSVVLITLDPSSTRVDSASTLSRIAFANGIAADQDRGKLWVASSLKGLYSYDFAPATPANLTHPKFYRSAVLMDNLIIDPQDGSVYGSSIPSVRAFSKSMASPEAPVPGSVTVKLVTENARDVTGVANWGLRKDEAVWEGVFVDDGRFYGALTAGGMVRGKYVGAGLLDKGVVVCDGNPMQRWTEKGGERVKEGEEVKDGEDEKVVSVKDGEAVRDEL